MKMQLIFLALSGAVPALAAKPGHASDAPAQASSSGSLRHTSRTATLSTGSAGLKHASATGPPTKTPKLASATRPSRNEPSAGFPKYPSVSASPRNHTSAAPTSTPTSDAPIWNLKNTSCYDLDHIKTGAEQWAALGGDQVLQNFTDAYNGDYTFCRECMGWPQGKCPQAQKGSPQFDPNCVPGVKSISSGRWDRAAAHYADITSDEDMSCGLEVSSCVVSASCQDAMGPGTWSLVKSLSTLNDLMYNTYEAINDAANYCNSQMTSFSSDFAPPPPPSSTAWFGLVNSFIGAIGGFISIAAPEEGILLSFAGSLTNSAISIAGASSSSAPADTSKPMGNMAQAAIGALENVTNGLFQSGSVSFPKAPDGSTNITLTQMFTDGQMMMGPTDYSKYQSTLVENFKKSLFQQTAVFTWKNLDSNKAVPYITFESGSCASNANGGPLDNAIDGIDRSDTSVDFNGTCYYLLGAVIDSSSTVEPCEGDITTYTCEGKDALPGGKHSVLTGSPNQYAGLTLNDFVVPAVKGWLNAGKSNNYPSADQGGSLIKDIQDPGVVTLPVCDFANNAGNPGIGCPEFKIVESDTSICPTHGNGSLRKKRSTPPKRKRSRVMQRC